MRRASPAGGAVSWVPWAQIKASLVLLFALQFRTSRAVNDAALFDTTSELVGVVISSAGHPRLLIRLMVSVLFLKHTSNECDESVAQRWSGRAVR